MEFDECIWCTQGAPQPWLRDSKLSLDGAGFIRVRQTLQSVSHPDVFASGDVCSVDGFPRPKAGVFAVVAGVPLATNLRNILEGKELVEHTPQAEFLGILGTGDGGAVASRGLLALEGEWVWSLKDWIDRKWMYDYTTAIRQALEKTTPAGTSMAAAADPTVRDREACVSVVQKFTTKLQGAPELLETRRLEELMGSTRPSEAFFALVDCRGADEQQVSMIPGSVTKEDFERPGGLLEQAKAKAAAGEEVLVVPYCTVGYRSGVYGKELMQKHGLPPGAVRNGEGILMWTFDGGKLMHRREDGGEEETSQLNCYGAAWDIAAPGFETTYASKGASSSLWRRLAGRFARS